jgi:hypothetical protein
MFKKCWGIIWEKAWLENSLSHAFSRIITPSFLKPTSLFTPTCLWRWKSVPKRRHINFRRRRITQKKAYISLMSVKLARSYTKFRTLFNIARYDTKFRTLFNIARYDTNNFARNNTSCIHNILILILSMKRLWELNNQPEKINSQELQHRADR